MIQFDIVPCEFGFLLAAQTERGLCVAALGPSDGVLEAELREEFPETEIVRDASALKINMGALQQRIAGKKSSVEIPLDVRATDFQMQVWRELQNIPCGQTRSYTQVAESLGKPSAARAVARACATNPVALAVPCHRVVRGDGSLAGYRWGIEVKRQLLDLEKEIARQ